MTPRDKALTELRVVKSCPANWNDMGGSNQARFCNRCSRNVYNLGDMDRKAIADLIEEKEGKVCVRYYLRPDGKIMTADCPQSIKNRVKFRAALGSVLSLFGIVWAVPVMGQAKVPALNTQAKSDIRKLHKIAEGLKLASTDEDRTALLKKQAETTTNLSIVLSQIVTKD